MKILDYRREGGIIYAQFENGEVKEIYESDFYEFLKDADVLDWELAYPTEAGDGTINGRMDIDQYFDNYPEHELLFDLNCYADLEKSKRKGKQALKAIDNLFNWIRK